MAAVASMFMDTILDKPSMTKRVLNIINTYVSKLKFLFIIKAGMISTEIKMTTICPVERYEIFDTATINMIKKETDSRETGDGRYKIYILHHIFLMKKLLHSILGLPLAHYVCYDLKGVLHPRSVLDCFCIFLKNYNTLVTSKICFL